MSKTFLSAEWRKLAMVNYVVDKRILERHLPHKTEIDAWNDRCYVSLVGFMFLNTCVLGAGIPFHRNFEEVNLRFYVRYKDADGWKRGVVFIKEIVPKAAITVIANTLYNEHYKTMPMRHRHEATGNSLLVEYAWQLGEWNSIQVVTGAVPQPTGAGSEEEFITEHYWGYTKRSDDRTLEYGVEHPKWDVYPTVSYNIHVDFKKVYGNEFEFLKNEQPTSVLLAEGSEIKVKQGKEL